MAPYPWSTGDELLAADLNAAIANAAIGGSTKAGGDLSGQYPNPTVTKINGVAPAGSATVDTTNAANITAGTLNAARLPLTAVTPGTYTHTTLTVDATGRLTAASSGTAVGSVVSVGTTGPGITGGPITTTGTLAVQWNAGSVSSLGSGLSLNGGVLTALPGGGSLPFSSITGAATYAQLPTEVQQVPVSFPWAGKPTASQVVNVPMVMALTVPSGLAGARVFASTAPSGTPTFTLNKVSGGSTTALGTIQFTSATAATLSGAGGSLAATDVLQLVAPSSQDSALSDLGITILASRV